MRIAGHTSESEGAPGTTKRAVLEQEQVHPAHGTTKTRVLKREREHPEPSSAKMGTDWKESIG
jgi:hypothetical protein